MDELHSNKTLILCPAANFKDPGLLKSIPKDAILSDNFPHHQDSRKSVCCSFLTERFHISSFQVVLLV